MTRICSHISREYTPELIATVLFGPFAWARGCIRWLRNEVPRGGPGRKPCGPRVNLTFRHRIPAPSVPISTAYAQRSMQSGKDSIRLQLEKRSLRKLLFDGLCRCRRSHGSARGIVTT